MTKGFGVYYDPKKTTSGQRFYGLLCDALAAHALPLSAKPTVILFNVSGHIIKIIKAKARGQKIVLRIDGLYCDRLSPAFLATFKWPLRRVLALGLRYDRFHMPLAHLANFMNQNYKAFLRIALADMLIYQSRFSRDLHAHYFPKKPYRIIVNGSACYCRPPGSKGNSSTDAVRLVTIFNDWKPAKRMFDLVEFVRWAREVKNCEVTLTMLGYTGKLPRCAPSHMKSLIENEPYYRVSPKFSEFSGAVRDALLESDMYITFTNRDSCPNVVVESMAHGLPVVGINSGGLPDIVGDAGILLPDDDSSSFFSSSRYEADFPPIDYEAVLTAVLRVKVQLVDYRIRVQRRFTEELGIDVVSKRYLSALRTIL